MEYNIRIPCKEKERKKEMNIMGNKTTVVVVVVVAVNNDSSSSSS
jgi:hypothetical protein